MTDHPEVRARVVVADDHPSVLSAFARLLKHSCDVVATAASGADAVDLVCRLNPDVLVVDLMMADVDGLEVCRRVKQAAPKTLVVIVTAFDDAGVRTVALQDGASAFVPKPSAASILERTIQRILADARAGTNSCAEPGGGGGAGTFPGLSS